MTSSTLLRLGSRAWPRPSFNKVRPRRRAPVREISTGTIDTDCKIKQFWYKLVIGLIINRSNACMYMREEFELEDPLLNEIGDDAETDDKTEDEDDEDEEEVADSEEI